MALEKDTPTLKLIREGDTLKIIRVKEGPMTMTVLDLVRICLAVNQ